MKQVKTVITNEKTLSRSSSWATHSINSLSMDDVNDDDAFDMFAVGRIGRILAILNKFM
jgi:hypothetical protein